MDRMDWPVEDLEFVSKLVHSADASKHEKRALFDYGPLIFPRLVNIVCSSNEGLRAAGLDALCRLVKVPGLGRMLVGSLCGSSGLNSSDVVVRSECALAMGRVLQSCLVLSEKDRVDIGWIRALPLLIRLSENPRTAAAAEQALLHLRTLLGTRTFNRRFTRALIARQEEATDQEESESDEEHEAKEGKHEHKMGEKRLASWTLWRILRGEDGFLESSVEALKALAVAIQPHDCTRREICERLLVVLDSFDMELTDAALHAIVRHFEYESCWEIIQHHPLAETIVRQSADISGKRLPSASSKHRPVSTNSRAKTSTADTTPSLRSSRQGPRQVLNRELDDQGDSLDVLSRSSQSEDTCSVKMSYLSHRSSSSDTISTESKLDQHELDPGHSAFTPPRRQNVTTPKLNIQSSQLGSPLNSLSSCQSHSPSSSTCSPKNSVFINVGNSMVKMNVQLSTLKRKNSARRRSSDGEVSGGSRPHSSSPLHMISAPGLSDTTGSDSVSSYTCMPASPSTTSLGRTTTVALSAQRMAPQAVDQFSQSLPEPLMNGVQRNKSAPPIVAKAKTQENAPRGRRQQCAGEQVDGYEHESELRHFQAEPGEEYTRNSYNDSGRQHQSVGGEREEKSYEQYQRSGGVSRGSMGSVSAPSARSIRSGTSSVNPHGSSFEQSSFEEFGGSAKSNSQGLSESPPPVIRAPYQLPKSMEGLLKVLNDDADWEGQTNAVNAMSSSGDNDQLPRGCRLEPEVIHAVVKLTTSLRSSLGKSSLVCLHALVSRNGPAFWKEQSTALLETVVGSMIKKTIDASGFLAQQARATLDACVVNMPAQRLSVILLGHCQNHANANARANAAQALLGLVQQHPQSSFDAAKIVRCAKEKLLHDNTEKSRAAAKGILTQLNETHNLDKKQQLHMQRIKLTVPTKQEQQPQSVAQPRSGRSANNSSIEEFVHMIDGLKSKEWHTRLSTVQELQNTMHTMFNPALLEQAAELAQDPNIKVRLQAIETVHAVASVYASRVDASRLATYLLPVAVASGDKQAQAQACACLQAYQQLADVAGPMRRHLPSLSAKAKQTVSALFHLN